MIDPWLEDFIKVNMEFNFIFNFDTKWVIDCEKELPIYKLTELNENPIPNKYVDISKKSHHEKYGGGEDKKKTLCKSEIELYKDPRWIGWCKIDINSYNEKDKNYLLKLQKYHRYYE